jgi:hypothetical protein
MINPRATNLIQLATSQTQNPHCGSEILITHQERTIIRSLNRAQFTLLDDTCNGPEANERPGDLADALVELGERVGGQMAVREFLFYFGFIDAKFYDGAAEGLFGGLESLLVGR